MNYVVSEQRFTDDLKKFACLKALGLSFEKLATQRGWEEVIFTNIKGQQVVFSFYNHRPGSGFLEAKFPESKDFGELSGRIILYTEEPQWMIRFPEGLNLQISYDSSHYEIDYKAFIRHVNHVFQTLNNAIEHI